jgi:hypothetical protein
MVYELYSDMKVMKNLNLLFILALTFPLSAKAQTIGTSNIEQSKTEVKIDPRILEIDKEEAKIQSRIRNQERISLELKERHERAIARSLKVQDDLDAIEEIESNFAQSRMIVLAHIDEVYNSLPIYQKIGLMGRFYKCLKSSLEQDYMNYGNCYEKYEAKLSDRQQAEISKWKESVGMSRGEIQRRKEHYNKEILSTQELITKSESEYEASVASEKTIKRQLDFVEIKRQELALIPKYADSFLCNANMKEINLEEEVPFEGASFSGPFHNVARDNQDGLGTCYANVTKNLLLGLSGGKDVASFLDIALQFKAATKDLTKRGLDSGNPCGSLEVLKKNGYCPQSYAPMENGESDVLNETTFELDPYGFMSQNINMIKDFFKDLEQFNKDSGPISKEVLVKAKSIIEKLKSNPDIQLPLPIVKNQIPAIWKLKEAYYINKSAIDMPLEDFVTNYEEAYKKFYPKYIRAIISKKSLNEVFEIYTKEMKPFFEKYNMEKSLPGFKKNFEITSSEDFKDPRLNEKMQASLSYLKEILNKSDLTDESFIAFCEESDLIGLNFLGSLSPLIQKLKVAKIDDSILFDKDGNFNSPKDLMQLTIAPSCLNEENRKEIPDFSCNNSTSEMTALKKSEISYDEKLKIFREKIVLSLLQGYPLGNSFKSSVVGAHINTIVGIRYDQDSGQCQYRIRESMDGTSKWQKEKDIFDNIFSLAEVRKQ